MLPSGTRTAKGPCALFSIIIPSRNIDNLTACVRAIRAARETARVIVVDDGCQWERYHAELDIRDGAVPFCS